MKMNLGNRNEDSFLMWVIYTMLGEQKGASVATIFPDREAVTGAEVRLTINGHEMPFDAAIKRLEEEYEAAIKAEAVKLLDTRFNSGFSALEEDLKAVRRHLRKKFELPEDDEYR